MGRLQMRKRERFPNSFTDVLGYGWRTQPEFTVRVTGETQREGLSPSPGPMHASWAPHPFECPLWGRLSGRHSTTLESGLQARENQLCNFRGLCKPLL